MNKTTEYVAWVKHKAGPRSKKLRPGVEAVTIEAPSKAEAVKQLQKVYGAVVAITPDN